MVHETKRKKKLYAEEDISKLSVIKSNDTIARKYMMCVAAASVAEGITYPLDLTKTRYLRYPSNLFIFPLPRLQIQGEISSGGNNAQYRGMFKTAVGIAKEEVSGNILTGFDV
jgi:hypothetical protein